MQAITYTVKKNSKVLLYSTGNYIQHLRINCNEEGYKKKNVYMHITEPLCCIAEINNIVSQLCEWKLLSHGWLFAIPWTIQNTGMGNLSLLQRIFSTQGFNPGLPHCRQIFYQLSHKESPRNLEWVAYPFSSGSSQPRNQTRVSCIAGGFFTNWAMMEAQVNYTLIKIIL